MRGAAALRGRGPHDRDVLPGRRQWPVRRVLRQHDGPELEPNVPDDIPNTLAYQETNTLAHQEIVRAGLDEKIPSGLVLTGGASALGGLTELAEEIFETPVRLGLPDHIGGLQDVVRSPMYATGVGLVLFGFSQQRVHGQSRFRIRDESIFGRVKQRMRDWFYGEFE